MPLRINVGRQRVTKVTSPSEGNYTRLIRVQMRAIRDNLLKVVEGIEGVTPAALIFGLQPIFDESQILVPVATGRLKRSGFLQAERSSTGSVAAVGYGKGGNPFYAGRVHERLDFRHKPPTQAKYLEEAVNRRISVLPERVVAFIKSTTGIAD